VISLRETLKLAPPAPDQNECLVIVTQVGNYAFGISVDSVRDAEEIVVKPVAPLVKPSGLYSGNTILGDGSVALIVDPQGILSRSGRIDTSDTGDLGLHGNRSMPRTDEHLTLLLVRAGEGMRKAIPLDQIARLEEVRADMVHQSNGRMLVKYRDRLMPLLPADPSVVLLAGDTKPVLVFGQGERTMGLVVDAIEDIIESTVRIEIDAGRPEVIGSSLIAGAPAEILNIGHYVTLAERDWFEPPAAPASAIGRRLLLVDDSASFRGLVSPLIRSCGLTVAAAASPRSGRAGSGAGGDAGAGTVLIPVPRRRP
jgi:two-component system chemotaxis sensor kinase CheA